MHMYTHVLYIKMHTYIQLTFYSKTQSESRNNHRKQKGKNEHTFKDNNTRN